MDVIALAIKFAELGFHVFPLYTGKNGQRSKPFGWARNSVTDPEHVDKAIPATRDVDEIRIWPELVKQKYNAEVGSFGVLGVDCVILDIDVKNGKDGVSELVKLQSLFNIPKPNMFTRTKSGGLHIYYRRPAKFKNAHVKTMSNVVIGPNKYEGIDLRGNGGFVVGPDEIIGHPKDYTPGKYCTCGLRNIEECPEFPAEVLEHWVRNSLTGDLENITFQTGFEEADYKTQIRKGIIPAHVPKGARNETFFIFVNVLKSKNVPKEVARQMCLELAKNVEEPDTLHESVDIEEMLSRVYVIDKDNPYDVAVDLVNHGLYQLTGYKSKLHYVIMEENPYIASRLPHDESTMKTLLARHQKSVQMASGKPKIVNPMDIVVRILGDENRADTVGFKPNGGTIFTLHDDPGSKRYLNTHKPIPIPSNPAGLDLSIWEDFTLLISRIFGPYGSEEYNLALDFLSWLIQTPEIKPSIAPFIMSQIRGVGKSLFFNLVIQVLGTAKDGERQGRLVKLDEITGRFFNPSGCLVNLIDEVQFPVHRDTRKESVTFWRHLKNLITAETISIEIKGGATYQVPNSAALILAGNTGSHFPIEEFDRRLWIIDANPPELERGLVDRLFDLVKGTNLGPDDRHRLLSTLRYQLSQHKISTDLSCVRAPMTEIKREMFMNSLTDIEEWFFNHFVNDHENLFAATPVISRSAFMYVVETSDRLANSKYREDTEALYRFFKRRGLIQPIRAKGNAYQSRNIPHPKINADGSAFEDGKREVMYTTREHGSLDGVDNATIIQAYVRNIHTINTWKGKVKKSATKAIENINEMTQ